MSLQTASGFLILKVFLGGRGGVGTGWVSAQDLYLSEWVSE